MTAAPRQNDIPHLDRREPVILQFACLAPQLDEEPDDRLFPRGWWLIPVSFVGAAIWYLVYQAVTAVLI
jgi:hypothetical protein